MPTLTIPVHDGNLYDLKNVKRGYHYLAVIDLDAGSTKSLSTVIT